MTPVSRHVARALGWLGLAAGAVLAGQSAPQLPTFRSAIDVVRLDVSVLDKDRRPVRDLVAADFAISVDGAVQPIVAFEAVVMPPREEPTAPWMRDVAPDVKTNALGEPRLFVIIMDDVLTPPDPYMVSSAKTIARAIVDNLAPSDLASVVFTKDNKGAQELTSDRARLMAAIDSFHYGWMPEFLTFELRGVVSVRRSHPQAAQQRDRADLSRRRRRRGQGRNREEQQRRTDGCAGGNRGHAGEGSL